MLDVDIEFIKDSVREVGLRAASRSPEEGAELKKDNSYVTDIDRSNENYLRAKLGERYPEFAFLGEEFGRHGSSTAPLWAVDPIDGTTNLVFGVPLWCVSVGLLIEGRPIAGALYLPRTDELFWAVDGAGAFCNGARLCPPDRDSLQQEDTMGFTSGAIKCLDVSRLAGRIRCLGSIATDIAYTARGSLCCLVGRSEGAYDMAAALCVAYEAGCVATYFSGAPIDLLEVMRLGKTQAPFVVAPPRMAAMIRRTLGV